MAKRLQHRVALDEDMGIAYERLALLKPGVRAREIVYLLRLGAEVHYGRGLTPIRLDESPSPVRSEGGRDLSGDPGRRSDPLADWQLDRMCTPPPKKPGKH